MAGIRIRRYVVPSSEAIAELTRLLVAGGVTR